MNPTPQKKPRIGYLDFLKFVALAEHCLCHFAVVLLNRNRILGLLFLGRGVQA